MAGPVHEIILPRKGQWSLADLTLGEDGGVAAVTVRGLTLPMHGAMQSPYGAHLFIDVDEETLAALELLGAHYHLSGASWAPRTEATHG